MHHIRFCFAEIAAEIDARLASDEHVLALAQLEEREANGDPLTVISAAELRVRLNREIERKGLIKAKAELQSCEAMIAVALAVVDGGQPVARAPGAHVPGASVQTPAAEIIDLAVRRQAADQANTAEPVQSPTMSAGRLRRAGGLIGGLIMAVVMGASTLEDATFRKWPGQIAQMAQIAHAAAPSNLVVADTE